jgi:hypothetical protein
MLSSEEIYISTLKTKMCVWNEHFPQIKIKEWMQEFLDEKVSTEIIRTTMLMCPDVGSESGCEAQLKERLYNVFGSIYKLMVERGIESSVTEAWGFIHDSVQYENPYVYYNVPIYLEAKRVSDEVASVSDEVASKKRARKGGEGGSVVGVKAWLQELKCL